MGHDIFKLNRKFVTKRIQEIENLFKESKVPSANITTEYQKLKKELIEVNSLKNKDLINLSFEDGDSLYKQVVSIQKPFIDRNPGVVKSWQTIETSGFSFCLDCLINWPVG